MKNKKHQTLCEYSRPHLFFYYAIIILFSSQKDVQCEKQDKGAYYE